MNALQELTAALVKKKGATAVGASVGVSRQMISAIASGAKMPGDAVASRLRELEAAIRKRERPAHAPTQPAPQTAGRGAALPKLWDVVDEVDEALQDLDPEAPATHRSSLFGQKIAALDKIARLQGEGELSAATMTKSKIWLDLLAKLRPVLERHPECASEIATVLESLEAA